MLNYAHLRYFWSVARDGNLTRTAERLNVSQSALSVQIRKLEDRLGHALFERHGRALHLTEAGRIALDHANSIFAVGDELLGTLGGREPPRQAVRIGALATLSRNFQIALLRPILGQAEVEIVLRSGSLAELLGGLQSLALDIVLTNQVPRPDALTPFITHRLSEQPVSLVGAPHLVSEGRTPAELLARHPVIVPAPGSGVRADFDALIDRIGVRPRLAAEVDDMAMMRLLASEGFALAVLPAIVVAAELASGALVDAGRLPGMTETFYAVTVARKFPNPVARRLIEAGRAATV